MPLIDLLSLPTNHSMVWYQYFHWLKNMRSVQFGLQTHVQFEHDSEDIFYLKWMFFLFLLYYYMTSHWLNNNLKNLICMISIIISIIYFFLLLNGFWCIIWIESLLISWLRLFQLVNEYVTLCILFCRFFLPEIIWLAIFWDFIVCLFGMIWLIIMIFVVMILFMTICQHLKSYCSLLAVWAPI